LNLVGSVPLGIKLVIMIFNCSDGRFSTVEVNGGDACVGVDVSYAASEVEVLFEEQCGSSDWVNVVVIAVCCGFFVGVLVVGFFGVLLFKYQEKVMKEEIVGRIVRF